jgi:hypothetical protein
MGSNTGRWVGVSPSDRKYPFKIAAKMARSIKSVTQDEAGQMVTDSVYFYDKFNEQAATIIELKRELARAEQTVRLLQVESD